MTDLVEKVARAIHDNIDLSADLKIDMATGGEFSRVAVAVIEAAALEQSTLEIKEYREALDRLIVAIEFEVPAIRDDVDAEERLRILMECATEARAALNHHEGSEG